MTPKTLAAQTPRSELTAAAVAAMIEQLRTARLRLLERDPADVVRALGQVAALWLGDDERRRSAARAVARSTGYAPAMIELCLRRTFQAWDEPHLRALLDGALAGVHLEVPGAAAADPEPTSDALRVATAPDLVLAILAQNTPGLAIAPLFTALALRAAIVVKSARGETQFAPLLARSIGEVDPELGAACAVHTWPGGTAAVEDLLFATAGRIVVYGSAATVAAVRARAGERVVAHGPRVSVAVVAGAKMPGFPAQQARALAREIAFLDQRGCLSPQLLLVDARLDRTALGAALARELATIEHEWPRRRLPLEAATAFRRAVDGAEADALAGNVDALHGGSHEPWAVVVEQSVRLKPTPLDRFVRLHPFDGRAGLGAALAPLRGVLECVGIAAPAEEHTALAATCRAAGAARICALDAMQDPPADWHGGGRPPVVALLDWSTAQLPERAALAPGAAAAPEIASTRQTELFRRHVAQTSDAPRALAVARASGARIFTRDGRSYVDMLAGIGVAAIGHAHPDVARAIARQAERYTHVMVYGEDVLEPQVEVATRLAALLPPTLSVTYLTNSGAEAIEGALKLVRKATRRSRVLAFDGAFHGDTTGALALGGNPFYREPFRPLVDGIEHLPWDDDAALARIDESVAAVFAEPVQAEAGVRVPRADFLPRLAARCRAVGALLVLDEVVTALGRTGRWFAFEHWPGATPDVLVLAKSLGGGLPLGAFVASAELMAVLAHDPPLGHVTTFGGNPVCCAAALASLDVLARERLPEQAAARGVVLLERLRTLVGRGGLVEVRGLGMLIGLEFADAGATQRFVAGCFARGVLLGWTLHHDRVVRLAPPLNIADEDLEDALRAMGAALDAPAA